MLEQSEYEPLNVHVDKENVRNAPISTRSSLASPSHNKWVDRMVQMAHACNNIVVKNCNLCHVYANKQVEFERSDDYPGNSLNTPATSVWSSAMSPTEKVWRDLQGGCGNVQALEVNLYRQFLFDEESVIDMMDQAMAKVDKSGSEDSQDEEVNDGLEATEEEPRKPELYFA